ncbi:LysM domain-containing protein [Chryseobacterium sp. BIGb0232]|uniref:LysM peptidoglycan-binding domain-containing protein n=1 Tax=Chryseobacterium sp. BIGb0232 TaxID=2940598 RepID=UPI000F49873E|nr:LysM domain-containing protein [Chryseobacterium sp. BIGb0232]MCS4305101.1 hypothetical protein [Chryseobacterium sp. BIGb0232]ROS08083.1 LysM domain-containing protein [Chryseobacterium nakagawai]
MKYIEYQIKQGDTLDSIAEENNIDIDELISFHNEHCGITQKIYTNDIPTTLRFIYISYSLNDSNYKPIKTLNIKFNDFSKLNYQSNHFTEMYINGGELSKYSQSQKFYLDFNSSRRVYKLDIYDNNIGDSLELYEKFDGLIEKIVKLKDNLDILVDEVGEIKDVLNKEELKENWDLFKKDLKENIILKEIPQDNFDAMLEKGDTEFSKEYPLADELKKSIFHSHLFFPLYNQEFKADFTNKLSNSSIPSSLFPNTIIPLTSVLLLIDNEYDNEYIFKIESQIDKSKLNYSKLEKLYHNNYPFLKDKFVKYTLDINRFYAINKKTLQIEFVDVEIEEVVNNNLEAYQKLEIEKLNTYES